MVVGFDDVGRLELCKTQVALNLQPECRCGAVRSRPRCNLASEHTVIRETGLSCLRVAVRMGGVVLACAQSKVASCANKISVTSSLNTMQRDRARQLGGASKPWIELRAEGCKGLPTSPETLLL